MKSTIYFISGLLASIGFGISPSPNVDMISDFGSDTVRREFMDTINIEPVDVVGLLTPIRNNNSSISDEYRKINYLGDDKYVLEGIVLSPVGLGMIFNVNRFYSHLSVSGTNARRLHQVLQEENEDIKINRIWYPLSASYSGLTGKDLENFRRYYRPDFNQFLGMPEESQLDYVIRKVKNYKDSVEYIRSYLQLP